MKIKERERRERRVYCKLCLRGLIMILRTARVNNNVNSRVAFQTTVTCE